MRPPPKVFPRWKLNGLAERAEIFYSLWGNLSASFGKKKFDWVMSGHGVMTSKEVQPPADISKAGVPISQVFLR